MDHVNHKMARRGRFDRIVWVGIIVLACLGSLGGWLLGGRAARSQDQLATRVGELRLGSERRTLLARAGEPDCECTSGGEQLERCSQPTYGAVRVLFFYPSWPRHQSMPGCDSAYLATAVGFDADDRLIWYVRHIGETERQPAPTSQALNEAKRGKTA